MKNDIDFFLEIFNNLLKINETEVFIVYDKNGEIWFKYKDLLKALQYTDIDHRINSDLVSIKNKLKYTELEVLGYAPVPQNFQKNTLFINEPGLYQVLSKSKKDIAQKFMDKYYQDIMPQIRKHGKYKLSKEDKNG